MGDLERRFGAVCELKALAPSANISASADASQQSKGKTVRVSTDKLDRQMASVEELLRLKVEAEERLATMNELVSSVARLQAEAADTRRIVRDSERGVRANGRSTERATPLTDHSRLAAAVELQRKTADEAAALAASLQLETRRATYALAALVDALHGDIRAVRMFPVEGALSSFGRMVRELSEVSGRGVGLAVTRAAVEKMGGRIDLDSVPGRGSRFKLVLPLNLATSRLLLVRVGTTLLGLPSSAVERVLRLERSELKPVDHGHACELDGKPVQVFRLAHPLSLTAEDSDSGKYVGVVLGAARIEHLDETITTDSSLAKDPTTGSRQVTTMALGVNYWYSKRFRTSFNYVLNDFGGDAGGISDAKAKLSPGASTEHEFLFRMAVAL